MSRHRFIRNLSKEELLDDGLDDSEEEEEDDYSNDDDLGNIDEHERRLIGQVHEVTAGAFTDRQVYDALYDTDGDVEAAVQILFDDGVTESLKKVNLEGAKSKIAPKAAPPPPAKARTPIQSPAATRRPVKHGVSPSPSSRTGTPSEPSLAVPMRPSSSTASSRGTPKMPKKLALDPAKEWAKRQASVASKAVKPTVHVAVVGHVDTGKSTLVGHLLNLLQLVDAKTMRQHQKQAAAINKSSFVYAWALDSSAEERQRGVTIDTATMSFDLNDTNIVILDNPGHKDFVANMIRGSCRADVGVLVISAMPNEFHSGFEGGGQTKEHAILLRSMGIRRMVVAVNKMDQAEWAKSRFDELCSTMTDYLVNQIGFKPDVLHFVPVSGLKGVNLVESTLLEGTGEDAALPPALTSWYTGPSLTGILNGCTPREMSPLGPTRFFVDDTTPGGMGNATVTCMGRLLRGSLQLQQQVLLLPQRLYGIVKRSFLLISPCR